MVRVDLTRQDIATTFLITLSLLVLLYLKADSIIDIYTLERGASVGAVLGENGSANAAGVSVAVSSSSNLGLDTWINNLFGSLPFVLRGLAIAFMTLACCWKSIRMVARYSALNVRTYTPAIIFTIYGCYYLVPTATTPLLSAYFLFNCIESIFIASKEFNATGRIFKAYTNLGLAIILSPAMLCYALLWPVGMTMVSRSWRYWVASLVGLLLPIAIYGYVGHFFAEMPISNLVDRYSGVFELSLDHIISWAEALNFLNPAIIATLIFIATSIAFLVHAFISSHKHSESMRTRQHKSFVMTNYLFILSIITILFCNTDPKSSVTLAVPLSIILPTYFNYNRRITNNILYSILLLSLVLSTILG